MRQNILFPKIYMPWVLIHASARDATINIRISEAEAGFNPRIREGCDHSPVLALCLLVLIHASARDATESSRLEDTMPSSVLIHASARDATAKSYKIGNNFTVLFRKFVQKFDIVTFYISIF